MIEWLKSRRFLNDFDWFLLGAALLLSTVGLVEIYSATRALGSDSFFLRQLAWVALGVVALFVVASVDYHRLAEHVLWLFLASCFILIYTLTFGYAVAGSKSWVSLGWVGFQPSEMAKLVVVVTLARYFSEIRDRYLTFTQILAASLICGVPMVLVALQPDLGTTLTFFPVLALGLFIRGVRPLTSICLILALLLLLPAGWLVLKDYQKDRILTFIHPETDPKGSGYQVIQSKIAIGSGGLWGKGVFRGSQNQLGFLPARHTDFIFSVVGEELGFLGVLFTLGLFLFIIFRSIYNAQTSRDSLGVFIIMGVAGLYVFHAVVNVGMVIGFMPITGIPLPFMSYGGSAVVSAFVGLGLIVSVRRYRCVN